MAPNDHQSSFSQGWWSVQSGRGSSSSRNSLPNWLHEQITNPRSQAFSERSGGTSSAHARQYRSTHRRDDSSARRRADNQRNQVTDTSEPSPPSQHPQPPSSHQRPRNTPAGSSSDHARANGRNAAASSSAAWNQVILFRCPQCPKSYLRKGSLKQHLAIKHGNRRFFCQESLCLEPFTTQKAADNHYDEHHSEDRRRHPVVCEKCGAHYRDLKSLSKHRLKAHS